MNEINRHNETEATQSLPISVQLKNLGTVNKNEVTIKRGCTTLVLTFSYETIVSFQLFTPREQDRDKATIKNYWSTTTGKLLNLVCPDHKQRVDREEFHERLHKAFKVVGK